MEILRSAGTAPGRSQGSAFGEFVWAVATDRTASATIEEQTRRTLSELDRVITNSVAIATESYPRRSISHACQTSHRWMPSGSTGSALIRAVGRNAPASARLLKGRPWWEIVLVAAQA